MARHNIQATSTVCSAAKHTWLLGLAANYRQCGQCRTVEVLKDGEWQSPTPRKRSSRVEPAPSYSWTQEMHLKDRDFQGEKTSLIDPPAIETVLPSHGSPVSPSVETVSCAAMTRQELGEKLFVWGTEHAYPQLHFQIPERVYTIADSTQSQIHLSGHVHTIVTGMAAWRLVCFQDPQAVVEAALEHVKTYETGQLETVLPSHSSPVTDIEHIERSVPLQGLDEVRVRFLALAKEAGYPVIRFRVGDDGVVYKIAKAGQDVYEDRARSASLGWLWNAIQVFEQRQKGDM